MTVTLKYFNNPFLTSASLNNPVYLMENPTGTILFIDLLEIECAQVVVELFSDAGLMSYLESNNSNILPPLGLVYQGEEKIGYILPKSELFHLLASVIGHDIVLNNKPCNTKNFDLIFDCGMVNPTLGLIHTEYYEFTDNSKVKKILKVVLPSLALEKDIEFVQNPAPLETIYDEEGRKSGYLINAKDALEQICSIGHVEINDVIYDINQWNKLYTHNFIHEDHGRVLIEYYDFSARDGTNNIVKLIYPPTLINEHNDYVHEHNSLADVYYAHNHKLGFLIAKDEGLHQIKDHKAHSKDSSGNKSND